MKKPYRFLPVGIFSLVLGTNTLVAQSINPNGGFEESTVGVKGAADVAGWTLLLGGVAAATFEIENFDAQEGSLALSVELTNVDANPWDVQAVNETFAVTPNTQYTYSVWAKADAGGPLVSFTVGDPSYREWGRAGQVAMTLDWQHITFDFTTPDGATTGRAPIHIADVQNASYLPMVFYIDNLQITSNVVGVGDKKEIPAEYKLGQNYPNPFNPSTTIEFSVPTRSDVRLSLMNVLGQVVKEMTQGIYEAGNHKVTLDASHLATGVYFYRLEAGNFVDVKKLVLAK